MASRYANTARTWAPHPVHGWVRVTHRAPTRWKRQRYIDYLSGDFDTFVHLATKRYNDPNMYWTVAEMNPEVLCPDDLTAGIMLQLPTEDR